MDKRVRRIAIVMAVPYDKRAVGGLRNNKVDTGGDRTRLFIAQLRR
jgi:hypothetical protein